MNLFDVNYQKQLNEIINKLGVFGHKIFVFYSKTDIEPVVVLPIEIENFASEQERKDIVQLVIEDTLKKSGVVKNE